MPLISLIAPSLWFAAEAEAAARFYVGIFPNSSIDRVTAMPVESPAGPPGSVTVVEFTLAGQAFIAMAAGPLDPFNHAISFTVNCADQAEVDRYWDALMADGGSPEQCGWLRDRFGVCWQVVPTVMADMMAAPDRAAAARDTNAMLTMVKLDVAALQTAFAG